MTHLSLKQSWKSPNIVTVNFRNFNSSLNYNSVQMLSSSLMAILKVVRSRTILLLLITNVHKCEHVYSMFSVYIHK